MPDLRETRRRLKIAFAVLAAVDVAAIAIMFSPLVGSEQMRRQQLDDLWKQQQLKTRQVEPLRGLDKKIVLAKQQIDNFYKDRLPDRDSAIAEALGRVASQTGVKAEHFKYSFEDTEAADLRPLQVEASLSGNYLQLVKFINGLERDQVFFIVNSVELGGEQAGVVHLQIKVESYLKLGTT